MHRASLKKFMKKDMIEISSYEVVENLDDIIQNPVVYVSNKGQKNVQSDNFLVIQCGKCKGILTHSGYWINGWAFSYVINCKIEDNAEIICGCGNKVGVKNMQFEIDLDNAVITSFPQKSASLYEKFSEYVSRGIKLFKEIKIHDDEFLTHQEKTLEDLKNIVKDLEHVVSIIKNKYLQPSYKFNPDKF